MTYEFIQAALTNLISFTAIAGFAGCVMHFFHASHKRWMAEYCPPVALLTSNPSTDNVSSKSKYFEEEIKAMPKAVRFATIAPIAPALNREQAEVEDIWAMAITTSSPRYWVRPTQPQQPTVYLLPAAKEEVKPATKKSRLTAAKSKTPATPRRKKVA